MPVTTLQKLTDQAKKVRTSEGLVAVSLALTDVVDGAKAYLGLQNAQGLKDNVQTACRSGVWDAVAAAVDDIEGAVNDALANLPAMEKALKYEILLGALWDRFQVQVSNGVLEVVKVGKDTGAYATGVKGLSFKDLDSRSEAPTIEEQIKGAANTAKQKAASGTPLLVAAAVAAVAWLWL
jgi:hypothetical protein